MELNLVAVSTVSKKLEEVGQDYLSVFTKKKKKNLYEHKEKVDICVLFR